MMKIKWRGLGALINDRAVWHKWFAWRPVRVDDRTVAWLCFVKRKGNFYWKGCKRKWNWQYELA